MLKARTDATRKIDELREEAQQRFQKDMNTLNRAHDVVGAVERRFRETGVFFMSAASWQLLEACQISPAGVMSGIARELERPYIRAREQQVYVYIPAALPAGRQAMIDLDIPNQKRLQPLIAPLTLIAEKVSNIEHATQHSSASVLLQEGKGTWAFRFRPTARQAFDNFVTRCHTDPVNRVILKL